MKKGRTLRKARLYAAYGAIAAMSAALGGCAFLESTRKGVDKASAKAKAEEEKSIIDDYNGLSRADYKKGLLPERDIDKFPVDTRSKSNAVPEIAPMLSAPTPPSFGTDKLVTLSVTEDVPVKDVLTQLASEADVDMEIDPGITGGVIFNVKNKPFSQVVDRIAKLAGLRYEYNNGILRVERDLPYQKNYGVDFLNLTRSAQGSVNITTQVLGGGSDGLTGGSSNAITSAYEGDVWAPVGEGIQSILDFNPARLVGGSTAGATAVVTDTGKIGYTVNKQAGVISVMATDAQHRLIDQYLRKVKESISAQVLIEAKVVEVTLNDKFNTGIDWGVLGDQNLGIEISGKMDIDASAGSNVLRIAGLHDLNAAVSLVKEFGTSRTLSSPRLHAMNNQQAVLTFAENFVYFTIKVEEETNNSGTTEEGKTLTVDSQLNTVPIGVIMTLQPSINLETQEVTMNIRPTLSRVSGTVSDPGVDIVLARNNSNLGVTSDIPVIEVRELDSVLKIKSGEVMVIGGLMREINKNEEKGVPYASAIPVFGKLLQKTHKETEVVETVIFIKATIVPSQGVTAEDQRVYNTFMPHDPRPLTF
ncbi:MAG: hypothetical protein ABW189_08235 [Rickettsiales bacterium]